ncbi:MAG: NADH-quinone oxidoreductase subunit NuoH [Anaerolineales bacterium]|nr:NADH-quinone oxidoreductase subunit NuoH [Anaerolineales bacterium]
MDVALWIEWIIKALILVLGLLTGFAYLTYMERKFLARFQNRYGPNRAGPFGLLQPVADGVKLIFKEELIPTQADKLIFMAAPIITTVPALIILGVLPFGGVVNIMGREVPLSIAGNLNVGVLYIAAITSISVYGIVLAGWSSNNKYATMGGIRSSAQMISYELALALSFVGPIMLAGSLSLADIVEEQMRIGWFIIYQPIGFVIFLIAALAEINRAPFDMPEAEQELTAGYHVEYSGMKFALFMMTEYIKMIVVSAIAATLFLGGYHLPFVTDQPWGVWLGPFILIGKIILLLWGIIWVRATLPRVRYDQLMAMGWKVLLPIALFNVFLTSVIMVLFPNWFSH